MKFELTDLRKQITDIEIINDLRSVANNLGKKSRSAMSPDFAGY